jgi:hypothetical protein
MSRPGATNFGRSGPGLPQVAWGVWVVVGIVLVPFLAAWLGAGPFLMEAFSLVPGRVASAPWTVFTYPFADSGNGGAFIFILFSALWAYWVCTPIEKETGSPLLLMLLGIFILTGGLALSLGAFLGGATRIYSGAYLPLAALTVLWAARNPNATVLLMMVIPVQAKWIGVISAAAVLFGIGTASPLVGVAALLPLALAAAYGLNRIPGVKFGESLADRKKGKAKDRQFNRFMDDVKKREKEREERERLRRLFESSLKDDSDRDKRDR